MKDTLLVVGFVFGVVVSGVGLWMLLSARYRDSSASGKRGDLTLKGPVGLFPLGAGITVMVLCFVNLDDPTPAPSLTNTPSVDSPPTPTTTTTTMTSPTPVRAEGSFRQPAPKRTIQAGQDVRVTGTVKGLPTGTTLWLVTTASNGGPYYYLIADDPTLAKDGSWNFLDEGVGDSTDVGGTITYRAVQADAACNQALLAAAQAGGDPPRVIPPPSCVDVATAEMTVT